MEPHSNFHEVSPIIEGDTAESVAGPSGSGEESQVLEVADEDVWVEEAAWEPSVMSEQDLFREFKRKIAQQLVQSQLESSASYYYLL